jgi:hypothetical protein
MLRQNWKLKFVFFVLILTFLLSPCFALADSVGERRSFYIDPSYDLEERESINAVLQEKSGQLYFYIDEDWWNGINDNRRAEINSALSSLSLSFNEKIYPEITNLFGFEWKPGIDDDEMITVLLHPMKKEVKGYYRTTDEYYRFQLPDSNEREMVYLNVDYIDTPLAKSYLAHEFQHLVTFNQKERKFGVSEDVWFHEMISEYAPTLVGFDNPYEGSNLEVRVESFLKNPRDSLSEWQGRSKDYGALNTFVHYLVEHYGTNVLVDSLHTSRTGIDALDHALWRNGFDKDFSDIFQDWMVAVLVNNCSLGELYCYKRNNLENLRIVPSFYFLPYVGKSSLTIEDSIKDWSGNWYKMVGGKGDVKLVFDGVDNIEFHVRYYLCEKTGQCFLKRFGLDNEQKGEITIPSFGSKYEFLTLLVFTEEKRKAFSESEPSHPFLLKATTMEEGETIKALLEKIAYLQTQIALVQAKINAILAARQGHTRCTGLNQNLYYGLKNEQVKCLQQFLKSQGSEIYPEGLVTGYFGPLTQKAVIRFQERYASDILLPLGLENGTGFVGQKTRAKINQLLSS